MATEYLTPHTHHAQHLYIKQIAQRSPHVVLPCPEPGINYQEEKYSLINIHTKTVTRPLNHVEGAPMPGDTLYIYSDFDTCILIFIPPPPPPLISIDI